MSGFFLSEGNVLQTTAGTAWFRSAASYAGAGFVAAWGEPAAGASLGLQFCFMPATRVLILYFIMAT